jgi:type I restriction enzyme R subunit
VRVLLALEIDRAMRTQAKANWRGDETKEREVQNFLFLLVKKNRAATLALFELVKNQPGY